MSAKYNEALKEYADAQIECNEIQQMLNNLRVELDTAQVEHDLIGVRAEYVVKFEAKLKVDKINVNIRKAQIKAKLAIDKREELHLKCDEALDELLSKTLRITPIDGHMHIDFL